MGYARLIEALVETHPYGVDFDRWNNDQEIYDAVDAGLAETYCTWGEETVILTQEGLRMAGLPRRLNFAEEIVSEFKSVCRGVVWLFRAALWVWGWIRGAKGAGDWPPTGPR
jgi:hypothetical protein